MDLLIEILSFVNDNYLKFAIGLVLTLMAIIGYYAEKTNFGNKLKTDTQDEVLPEDTTKIDNFGINDVIKNKNTEVSEHSSFDDAQLDATNLNSTTIQTEINQDNELNKNQNLEINNNGLIQPPTIQSNIVKNEINAKPITVSNNDSMVEGQELLKSTEFVEATNKIETDSDENKIEEDLNNILSKNNSMSTDLMLDIEKLQVEPLAFEKNNTDSEVLVKLNSNIDLPEIDDMKSDIDIWKF